MPGGQQVEAAQVEAAQEAAGHKRRDTEAHF